MKFQEIRPLIRTKAFKETISFYTEILGFTCEAIDEESGWASLHRDQVCIMVASPNEHELFEKPVFTGSLYISVNDVDEYWDEIKERTNIVYPLETFEYGMREFAITDNNGYILQFGQPLD